MKRDALSTRRRNHVGQPTWANHDDFDSRLRVRISGFRQTRHRRPNLEGNYLLISDLDGTLLGDDKALEESAFWHDSHRGSVRLAYNSGRFFESVADVIHAIARSIFRKMASCFEETDIVAVVDGHDDVSITYASPRASCDSRDVTRLKCRVDFSAGQMWIDDLRVARRLRSNGVGRQLVVTAETLALAFGLRTVHAFPLVRARRFWRKMGYTSHPTRARVVKKSLPPRIMHDHMKLSRHRSAGTASATKPV